MTPAGGQTDPTLRVAAEWPPGGSARLDLAMSQARRRALPPGGHSTATRAML